MSAGSDEFAFEGGELSLHAVTGAAIRYDGAGHAVRFNGWEHWTLADNGLIAISDGRFDTVEYERQLAHGI